MNKFGYRQGIISGIIISVCVVYLLRLFTYQVVSDKYKVMAENNSQRTETEYPARGLIYDRNNKLLVDNQAAYDLMIIPNQVKKFDTLELISILDITKESLEKRIQDCRDLCEIQTFGSCFSDPRKQICCPSRKTLSLSGFLHTNQNVTKI